ncbi:hypothetical protein BKI52_36180 [marine bacterium AO1-C]|nr:hypothetical protein BKI52_36180 [marine bacterium AO1-C]
METKSTTLNFEYGIASEMEPNQMLTKNDYNCFEEISKILKKYQAQNRFGITLLDTEESNENAMRLETNSIEERTLFSQLVEKGTVASRYIETNWNLNIKEAVAACSEGCIENQGNHTTNHRTGQEVGK